MPFAPCRNCSRDQHKKHKDIECQVAEPHDLKVQEVTIHHLGKDQEGGNHQANSADYTFRCLHAIEYGL